MDILVGRYQLVQQGGGDTAYIEGYPKEIQNQQPNVRKSPESVS